MPVPEGAEPLHCRQHVIEAYHLGDGRLLLRGELIDRRSHDSMSGERLVPAGKRVHTMICELEIDTASMEILAVRGEMPDRPYGMCPDWLPRLQGLEGVRITRGFNGRLRELMGGPLGCAHFSSLLTAMAPVALQALASLPQQGGGEAAYKARVRRGQGTAVNSCHVLAEGSPVLEQRRHWEREVAQEGDGA